MDILKASLLVKEEDGNIVVAEHPVDGESRAPYAEPIAPLPSGKKPDVAAVATGEEGERDTVKISLSICLNVDAKPDELDGIGEKLRQIIDALGEEDASFKGGGTGQDKGDAV